MQLVSGTLYAQTLRRGMKHAICVRYIICCVRYIICPDRSRSFYNCLLGMLAPVTDGLLCVRNCWR